MLIKLSIFSFVLGLAGAACTKSNPISCVDEYCQDPSLPFCDVDGALEGTPQTCIAVDCTSGDVAGCRGDSAIVCNADGNNYDISHCDHGCDPVEGCKAVSCVPNTTKCGDHTVETCSATGELTTQACAAGCVDGATPHCAYISPKYLPEVCDTPAVEAGGPIATSSTYDTGVDGTCNGGVVPQPNGPDICVLRFKQFAINQGVTLRVTGARVLAIVTDDALRVSGTLDVSSDVAGVVGAGRNDNYGGSGTEDIRGGAGFATNGGDGGASPSTGGLAYNPLDLTFLVGGRNGGVRSTSCGGGGGAGGGGATLISCRQTVAVDGTIDASGGGGRGGRTVQSSNCPGGGGGAGGYVVLQGVDVRVSGRVFANGGGGGCGKPASANGLNGTNGAASTAAPVGCTPSTDEGLGGAGGAEGFAPGSGGPGAGTGSTARTPGGGGASKGFFQTYTPAGVVPTLTPSARSPAFQPNLPVPTK